MKSQILATVLALAAGLSAQSYVTSPAGHLSGEGYSSAYIFGEWSEARVQFLDGEMRNTAMFIKEVAFRPDGDHNYTGNSSSTTGTRGAGRSWSNVSLDIAPCDYAKASLFFTLNQSTTPTRVFSASMSWPTLVGYTAARPAAFSINFPFSGSSGYFYNGQTDLSLDFDFDGGKLSNGCSGTYYCWPATWYQSYNLDAPNIGTTTSGWYKRIGTGCKDSSIPSYTADTLLYLDVFNSNYTVDTTLRNNYRVKTRSRSTAPGAAVAHCLSLFGSETGYTLPFVSCDKAFIDLNQPYYLFFGTATNDTNANTELLLPLLPYQKSYERIRFYLQAAWNDSKTGYFSLSRGEVSELPPMPSDTVKRACIFNSDDTKTTGQNDTIYKTATHNPVIRYQK